MNAEQQYIEFYHAAAETIKSRSCAVLNAVRDDAFNQFLHMGFPTQKVEHYKYTDVSTAFAPNYGITLNPQLSTLNPRPSTLNAQPSTDEARVGQGVQPPAAPSAALHGMRIRSRRAAAGDAVPLRGDACRVVRLARRADPVRDSQDLREGR